MLKCSSGGSFSVLEVGLESHFWEGAKSDLFTRGFFVDGNTGKVYKSPQWSAIQLGS